MTLFVIVFLCALGLWWGARRLNRSQNPPPYPRPGYGRYRVNPYSADRNTAGPAGPRFTSHGVRGRNHQVATGESSIHSMRLARGRSRRATLSTPARSATLGRELRALPSTLLTRELVPPRISIARRRLLVNIVGTRTGPAAGSCRLRLPTRGDRAPSRPRWATQDVWRGRVFWSTLPRGRDDTEPRSRPKTEGCLSVDAA